MLPAKYQPNPLGFSGKEEFRMVFTLYGHGGHLDFQIMIFVILILYNYHINAKYEISFKLAQYFYRKCHLNLFVNGWLATKVAMQIFIKT